jgi:hypothetical protein
MAPLPMAARSGRGLLVAIIGLAAYVRFTGLEIGWFLQDQVRDGMAALGIVSGDELPLVGPQAALSTVNLVGPLYYYLLALPYALSADPVVGVAFLNLLNLVAVYLTYRLGNDMFGPSVGVVAAALYAVFPAVVLSGKALWNPGFVPFFAMLFWWALWRFLMGSRPWLLALVLFLLGVLLNIHMSGAIFALLLPLALLLYRPPLRPGPLVVGILGGVALYLPYLLFELRQGFPDLFRAISWAGKNPSMPFWSIAWRGFWVPFLLPERWAEALPHGLAPWLLPWVQRAELALCVVALVALVGGLPWAADRRPHVLLAGWLLLPYAVVPFNRVGVMWYYFDIVYPAPFLAIARLSRWPWRGWAKTATLWRAPRWAGVLAWGALGGFVLTQSWFLINFAEAVARAGVLRITPEVVLSAPLPRDRAMETMPLGYKKALAAHFLRHFGADHLTLERRAHGAIYEQFREDKGFLFRAVARGGTPPAPDPAAHYLLLRRDAGVAVEQGQTVDVGPYTLVAYRPMIQYETWRWSATPGPEWWREEMPEAGWMPSSLPVRRIPDAAIYEAIPYAQWPASPVAFRGWMEVPAADEACWLAINIRHPHGLPQQVSALYVNGRPIAPLHSRAYDGINSRSIEVIADVAPALRPGANLIAFAVAGDQGLFDLDVYELRRVRRLGR